MPSQRHVSRKGRCFGSRLLLPAGLCAAVLWGGPSAAARDEWQLWQESTTTLLKKESYSLYFYEALRIKDDFGELYYAQAKIAGRVRLAQGLLGETGYSFIQHKNAASHWMDEHRAEVALIPNTTWRSLILESRSRLEVRWIEGTSWEEEWRLRQRFQVTAPVKGIPWLRIFANEEIFYATPPDEWNQNRFFAGITLKPSGPLALSAAWGVQSLRDESDWIDRQILFLNANVQF